jgi:hypothetical protein
MPTYFLYISIFIFAAFSAYIVQYSNDYSARISARFICFLALFLPAALRYGIGSDYFSYIKIYEYNFPDYLQRMEPGVRFIGYLCHKMQLSPHIFIAVISGITYILLCFCIPRNHYFTIIMFYILSFIYLNSYSMIRQCLATSFLLCGFSLFYNNHKIKGILLFTAASMIHYSSLVAFPIIAISFLNINTWFRFCLMAIVFIVGINEYFLSMLISLASLINPRIAYISVLLVKPKLNFGFTSLIFMLPSVMILINQKYILQKNNGKIILNANAIYVVIMLMSFNIAIIGRITQALFFIPLFSIQILYSANKKHAKLYHILFVLCFCAIFIRYIDYYSVERNIKNGIGFGISPYNSIFNK